MTRLGRRCIAGILVATALMLSSCSSKKMDTDLDLIDSADQLLDQVKQLDYVVHENGDVVSGQELWTSFYETTQAGMPASVKIADYYEIDKDHVSPEYYEENKENYPVIYLAELSYDGKGYTYHSLNGQDGKTGYTRHYPYLMRYEDTPGEQATFTFCVRYVLVHDNTLTYEQIQHGLFSSQIGDYIEHTDVYQDYTYKSEYQSRR